MIKVFKFGGASVRDAASVKKLGSILRQFENQQMVVVVSAMGKTTNALEALLAAASTDVAETRKQLIQLKNYHLGIVNELFPLPNQKLLHQIEKYFSWLSEELLRFNSIDFDQWYDQVVCFGELLSTLIVSDWLDANGIACKLIDSREYVVTDNRYRSANVDWKATAQRMETLKSFFNDHHILLTQGFIGRTSNGQNTTLGREGSDFSAAIFAYCLDAADVTIWKDVPGLLNADPKRMEQTVQLYSISYNEAIELAFYGATVIHPKTIKPLQNKSIPLFVRSFVEPDRRPTMISENLNDDSLISSYIYKDNQLLVSLSPRDFSFMDEGCLEAIFGILSRQHIHTNVVQTSALSLSLCIDDRPGLAEAIIRMFGDRFFVRYNHGLHLLTIRHYDETRLSDLLAGKKVLVEQRSRTTLQFVLSE